MYYVTIYPPYTVEQIKDTLAFYKNKTLIGEMPIDNYDIRIKCLDNNIRVYFHLKSEKMPTVIPRGYSNPELIECYYRIKDMRNFQEDNAFQKVREISGLAQYYNRELAFIDTSVISEEKYFDFWGKYGYTDLTIPKSFWMQVDWRHYCNGWTTLSQTLSLVDNFDIENKSTSITKSEVCYLAYMRRMGHILYKEIKDEIIRVFKEQNKEDLSHAVLYPYNIGFFTIPNDNWTVLAVDDNKNYSLIAMDDSIDGIGIGSECAPIIEIPVDFKTKSTAMWGIPVIHTKEDFARKKSF